MSIKSILVVDDDAVTTRAMQRVLEPLGYIVSTAAGAWEAIRVLDREVVDCSDHPDILMPDGDGFELIGAMRKRFGRIRVSLRYPPAPARAAWPRIPGLLIARGNASRRVVLRKPITREELVVAIGAVENRSHPPGEGGGNLN